MNTQTIDIYQKIKQNHKHNQTLIIEPSAQKLVSNNREQTFNRIQF